MENGKAMPSVDTLISLSKIFEISIDDLLDPENDLSNHEDEFYSYRKEDNFSCFKPEPQRIPWQFKENYPKLYDYLMNAEDFQLRALESLLCKTAPSELK